MKDILMKYVFRKNICLSIVAALVISLLLPGCGDRDPNLPEEHGAYNEEEEASNSKLVENITYPVTIKVGYSTGAADPRGVALEQFKEEVEEETDHSVKIDIHPEGELGSDGELIAGLITGDVDITVSSAGNYALYATRLGVSALPFLFDDFESAWKFIDSDTIQAVGDDLEEYNMHILAYFDNGFRCVTTSEGVGPIKTAEDMEGLNIRTPDNQIVMETMSELGATPRSYPFAELMAALKDGTFDAQENPIPVIYNNNLYEVQKYLSVTNHSYDAMPLTIRSDLWMGLKDEYKTVIVDAAKRAQDYNRSLVKKQTEDYVDKLEEEGMKVNYPDLAPFRKATAGVMKVFEDVFGEDLINYVKESTN